MAPAQSISISQFTTAVQAALKAAVQKHPKFAGMHSPEGVTFSYLIRGIPPPEPLLAKVTVAELQAFSNDLAAGINAHAGVAERAQSGGGGGIFSVGRHIIVGIPPAAEELVVRG